MECVYCGFNLPPIAKFCPKCTHQVVCRKCEEALYKDSLICISCGEPINNNSSNATINNIEFTENEKGKSFKASFTDNVAGNVVQTLAQFLPINNLPQKKALLPGNSSNEEVTTIEITEIGNPSSIQHSTPPIHTKEKSDELTHLSRIFKNKNGVINIYDTRIKAKSKTNFVARITLLYLYYKYLQGVDDVNRNEVTELLQTEKLYNSSFRAWLSQNKTLIDATSTTLELRPQGIEEAQRILAEFNNPSIIDEWELQSSGKNSSSKEESKNSVNSNGKAKPAKKSLSCQIVNNLNLKPSGKESLIDFYSKYKAKGTSEYILLFIYYLERILKVESITINHVYTCYKEIGLPVPNNLYQSIINAKTTKGWIDTSNMNDLKVPTVGENYVEYTMKK